MSPSKYLIAFGAGAVVGVGYGLIKVRSPAPPIIARVGLLGILSGEWCVRNFMGTNESPASAQGAGLEAHEPGESK
jgi:XapX domain-containing protein